MKQIRIANSNVVMILPKMYLIPFKTSIKAKTQSPKTKK